MYERKLLRLNKLELDRKQVKRHQIIYLSETIFVTEIDLMLLPQIFNHSSFFNSV